MVLLFTEIFGFATTVQYGTSEEQEAAKDPGRTAQGERSSFDSSDLDLV